jgi:hypothetical protein
MKDLETKQKVLKEIIDLMDSRDGDKLKSHPKLMAAKVEIAKPEDSKKEESKESPLEESSEEEVTPEMLKKLLDHFEGL